MSLEQLWAGWRSAYVASIGDGAPAGAREAETGVETGEAPAAAGDDRAHCVFCRIAASSDDEANYVVRRCGRVLVMLNAYPYASGHLMVMPERHVGELEALEDEEAAELWSSTERAVRALKRAYAPDGLNLGLNLGRAAGAGIPAHLHVHVVPRWFGDTNFMTTVASVRVLPEAISDSWSKLRAAWPD